MIMMVVVVVVVMVVVNTNNNDIDNNNLILIIIAYLYCTCVLYLPKATYYGLCKGRRDIKDETNEMNYTVIQSQIIKQRNQ